MVYLIVPAGGWIADRFTGQRRAVFCGGVLIAPAILLMAPSHHRVLPRPRPADCAGHGFAQGNVSTMVGELYTEKTPAVTPDFPSSTWASISAP